MFCKLNQVVRQQTASSSSSRCFSVVSACVAPLLNLSNRGEWKQIRYRSRGCPRYLNTFTTYYTSNKADMDTKQTVDTKMEDKLASSISAMNLTNMTVKPLLGDDAEALHPIKLLSKSPVNHDTRIFRFALPSPQQTLGVPVGQHVGLQERIKEEDVLHWYTPLSCEVDKGTVELLIKIYGCCTEFPEGGRLTQHLEHMNVGDTISVRGPRGKLRYLGRGNFLIDDDKDAPPRTVHVKRVNMVAGGSGLAPMLQLLRAKAKDPEDTLETCLLFANQTEQDIMMREELEQLKQQGILNKLWYTVDRPPPGWKYSEGYVTDTMLKEHLYPPEDDTLTLMCGRKAMVRGVVRPLLLDLKHKDSLIFKY